MNIYTKYILKRLTGPMLLICFSLTGIAWLTQSLRFIDMIVNRGLGTGTFLYISALILPSLIWIIIPISLFITVMVVYQRLSSDSEMVILRNSGISRLGIVRPVIYFAMMVTAISYLVGLYLLPASYREFKDMQTFIRDNYASLLLQEGVFSTPNKGLTVYIRERDKNGRLNGLLVHDKRKEDQSVTYMAQHGELVKGPNGPMVILNSGNRQEINRDTKSLSLLYFERYALDLALFNIAGTHQRWREPKERYIHELFWPEETSPDNLSSKLTSEAHHRITWPLYNILLALVAVFAFVRNTSNRRMNFGRIIFSVAAGFGIIIWGLGISNALANNPSFAPSMYASLLLGLIVTSYISCFNHFELMERFYQSRFCIEEE